MAIDSELVRTLTKLDEVGVEWKDAPTITGTMEGRTGNGYNVRVDDTQVSSGFVSAVSVRDQVGRDVFYRQYEPGRKDQDSQHFLRKWIASKVELSKERRQQSIDRFHSSN